MTDIMEEYRTVAQAAGWIDRSSRGRIRFAGADAVSFLQALVSNDVARLTQGTGVYATYLTPQGRMIADLEVLHRGDWLLGSVADGLGAALAARFDQLVFSEDVTVADVTADWAELAVAGGDAPRRVARALGLDEHHLEALPELSQVDWANGFVARAGDAALPTFRIFAPAAAKTAVVTALEAVAVTPMSEGLAEALRVEAGRAAWGRDLTTETIPLEAGLLERGISTAKGCYVGQEVIIRILHRGGGRVAKRLVMLTLGDDPARVPAAGATLADAGRPAGYLTSVAFSPSRHRVVALAYVPRESAEIGKILSLDITGDPAEVVAFAS
jgi:folate-binding protein YgfZ